MKHTRWWGLLGSKVCYPSCAERAGASVGSFCFCLVPRDTNCKWKAWSATETLQMLFTSREQE